MYLDPRLNTFEYICRPTVLVLFVDVVGARSRIGEGVRKVWVLAQI
jgi:hypothetical protein